MPLERYHNQALQLITGAVNTTPVHALLFSTHHMSMKSIVDEKAYGEKNFHFMKPHSLLSNERVLICQRGFLQRVLSARARLGLDWEAENFIRPQCPLGKTEFRTSELICFAKFPKKKQKIQS